jgi:uncharacterized protein (DUF2267 family)
MSATGLDSLDAALQKTEIWIKEIMREMNTTNKKKAYNALRAVLYALRDRLPIDEAANLGAQLPLIVRGIYYDEWKPSRNPIKDRHLIDFIYRVTNHYHAEEDENIEALTKAVFRVIKNRVTDGEIEDVKSCLPQELRELWE